MNCDSRSCPDPVTGDEQMTMTLAEVDDSSAAQYSYKRLMTVWTTPLKEKVS